MAVNQELRSYLNQNYEGVVLFDEPSFDYSIVGVSDDMQHLIYDFDRMVQELMEDDEIAEEDAIEFIEYNTCRSLPYAGENGPIIFRRMEY